MIKLSKKITTILLVTTMTFTCFSSVSFAAETSNSNGSSNTITIKDGKLQLPNQSKLEVNQENNQVSKADKTDYGLCTNTKDGVILHAFCWSFNTIKENMKDIADAGYSTVQTSPANACNDSHPGKILYDPNNKDNSYDGANGCWWWHYQPTDWKVGNYQLGTRDDYKAMCEEADKYGIKIITDVLPNHTTPDLNLVSNDLANAAGGKSVGQLYHSNGFNEIQNYNDRYQCTLGQMGGLPDVNTENQGFQEYYIKYCNDLISLGCDGFRYDTAKHIGVPSDPKDASNTRGVNDFWDVATGKKAVNGVTLADKDRLFIYGEVLQDQNIPYNEYASYMNMTASGYGGTLRSAIGSNDFSVGKIQDWNHPTPNRIVTWVESHDTYFNNHESAWLTDWQIRMAWAIIAARSQGTPLFFSRPDGSNGHETNYVGNNVLGAKGNDQFKDPEVKAVNRFRNAMVGQGEYLRNPGGNSQILQIDRGTKGTCIINLGGDSQINNDTTMADGTYKDQVSGGEFKVSGGKISGNLKGGKVAVIYDPAVQSTGSSDNDSSGNSSSSNSDSSSNNSSSNNNSSNNNSSNNSSSNNSSSQNQGKNVAYLKLPSGWNGAYAYVYNDNPVAGAAVQENAKWPGVKMTEVSDGLYKYEIPSGYTKPLLIFNDGNNQYPSDRGLTCTGSMIYDGTSWTSYDDGSSSDTNVEQDTNAGGNTSNEDTNAGGDNGSEDTNAGGDTSNEDTNVGQDTNKEELSVKLISSPSSLSQETGTKIVLTAEAKGGNENYTYTFSDGNATLYNGSKSTYTWIPDEVGIYNVKVTVDDGDNVKSDTLKFKINQPVSDDSVSDDSVSDNPVVSEDPIIITSFVLSKTSGIKVGDTIKISAKAESDNGNVEYRYYAKKNGVRIDISEGYTSEQSYNWTLDEPGTYEVYVKVRDEKGKILEGTHKTIVVSEDNNSSNSDQNSEDTADSKAVVGIFALLVVSGGALLKSLKRKNYKNI